MHRRLSGLLLLILLCACSWPGDTTRTPVGPTPATVSDPSPPSGANPTPDSPIARATIAPVTRTPAATPGGPSGLFATWTVEAAAEAATWARLAQRPLRLPTVAAGAPCPRGPVTAGAVPDFPRVGGAGPIYVSGWDADGLHALRGRSPATDGWYYVKQLWIAIPDYRDPALVRGRRLDGAGELRFADSFGPGVVTPEMARRLGEPHGTGPTGGMRIWGGYTLLATPGCYAYQVDGTSFSEVVVFEVVP